MRDRDDEQRRRRRRRTQREPTPAVPQDNIDLEPLPELSTIGPESKSHRERAIYIKMRPLFGIDFFHSFKNVDYDTDESDDKDEDDIKKEKIMFSHWAIEVGPWTIELAKDPRDFWRPMVRSTHVRDLDPTWDTEIDRLDVGTTRFSDQQLSLPESFIQWKRRTYDLKEANCQVAATMAAVAIAENRGTTFDKILTCRLYSPLCLDINQPFEHLGKLEPHRFSHVVRAFFLGVRKELFKEESERDFLRRQDKIGDGSDGDESDGLDPFRFKYLKLEASIFKLL